MSNWEIKAVDNQKSARFLIDTGLFSSSVHCSYYSNVQLIMHIFLVSFGWTKREIERNRRHGSFDEKGFHNWIEKEIRNSLYKKEVSNKYKQYILRALPQLKSLRVKADYDDILINEKKSSDALNMSKQLTDLLTKIYLS